MVIPGHNLGNSQVSVNRTIGPTLVLIPYSQNNLLLSCFELRQRILCSAFLRSIKDPFPPARQAGIIGMTVTQHLFTLTDLCQKLMPPLCSMMMDPEKQVRDQVNKKNKSGVYFLIIEIQVCQFLHKRGMLWVLIRSAFPGQAASNEYPQHMFLWRTYKN